MALYTETADILGEYEAAVGSLSDDHFVDIQPVLQWGADNRMVTQRDIWLRTAKYGTSPSADDEYWWLMGDMVTTAQREQGVWIKGSGNHGGGRVLDAVDGRIADSFVGPGTRLTRNDTGSGTPDLTYPFFRLRSSGDRLSGFYLRGVYDSDDITASFPQPEVAVQIEKGSGVGTGKIWIHDVVFQYFDRGIDIGANSGSNCDRVWIQRCGFAEVGKAIRLNHGNVINVMIGPHVETEGVDILCDVVNGGMVFFDNIEVIQDDLIVLKVRDGNLYAGQFNFLNLKFDNIGENSVAVDMTTSEVDMHNHFNFIGGKDSRIFEHGDHSVTLGRFHGNCVVSVIGMSGVGDIVVSGGKYTGGDTDRTLSAPFINLIGCTFFSKATAENPRLLLKKPDGTQAVEGVDYSGLYWGGCQHHTSAGTPMKFGQLVGPRAGGSNFAFTPDYISG